MFRTLDMASVEVLQGQSPRWGSGDIPLKPNAFLA